MEKAPIINKQTITSGVIGIALTAAIMTSTIPTENLTVDRSIERPFNETPVTLEIPTVYTETYTLKQLDATIAHMEAVVPTMKDLDAKVFFEKEIERFKDIRGKVSSALQ